MKTMTALLLTATLALANEDFERKLELKVSLDVAKTPLREVIDQLRDATGLNFVVAEGGDTQVSIKVRDLKVRSLIHLLLKPLDLTAAWEQGAVVIRHRRCGTFATRIYDVRGLTLRIQSFPGSDLMDSTPICCLCFVPNVERRAQVLEGDELIMLIKSHIGDLRTWTRSEGSISIRNGLLVVRQTPSVHREVASLLKQLGL